MKPREVKAGNSGPFTLDGTRTYLIGERQVALIDPGPDVDDHIRALCVALETAEEVRILLTHSHSDHAGAAPRLVRETGASLFAHPDFRAKGDDWPEVEPLAEGDRVSTDQGELVALEIPGHSRDHLGFHWQEANAVFVGDLLLGRGKTTWVGEYLGSVEDYLSSLDKMEALGASVFFPTHGPAIRAPGRTVDRFRRHRLGRLEEVRSARGKFPGAGPAELAAAIYGGEIPEKLLKAATSAVEAALFHLEQVDRSG